MSTTVFNFTNIARTVLHIYGEYELDYGFERATSIPLPFPSGSFHGDDAIQSRWTEFGAALADRRDGDAEEHEAEYVERILMPLWSQESDVLMLPATAIIAAHEAGVKAYQQYMQDEAIHAFYEDGSTGDLRSAREAARVAMIASINEAVAAAKVAA